MIKVPANLLSGENPLLGCRVLTSHFALTRLREERALQSPFPKGLISFTEAPLSQPDYLQKARPPSSITLGVRISSCEFRGDRNTQTIAGSSSHGSLENSISVSWHTFTNHPYSTYAQQSLKITVSCQKPKILKPSSGQQYFFIILLVIFLLLLFMMNKGAYMVIDLFGSLQG